MVTKAILVFLFIVSVSGIIFLYAVKLAYHFQYLRVKDKKNPGSTTDFFYRHFTDKKDGERWKEAWLKFPLLYPVVLDDERQELNDIKKGIKRINMAIYVALIVAFLVVFYTAKAFPQGIY